jgi:hypothetical protein
VDATTYHGIVKNGTVVLKKKTKLPEGTEVLVTPIESAKGSPSALLEAALSPPHLKHTDVKKFRRVIEEGARPASFDNPFKQQGQELRRNRKRKQ